MHVHLGTRLEALDRVRSGRESVSEVAARLGLDEGQIETWRATLVGQEVVTFEACLSSETREQIRLRRRVLRLKDLIAEHERQIRQLAAEMSATVP